MLAFKSSSCDPAVLQSEIGDQTANLPLTSKAENRVQPILRWGALMTTYDRRPLLLLLGRFLVTLSARVR